jgi:trk system potassium uptake protein TrkA
MRTAFIGTNSLTLYTAMLLLEGGHEVVIIERKRERIDELSERLDCGFIHGDGTSPDVLRDAEPENTDVLFCLLESDQTNILAGLIGRSLGFARVVPRVNDPQFQRICSELGLEDSVMPNRAVAMHLEQMVGGDRTSLELTSVIRADAAVFSLVVPAEHAGAVDDLPLPDDTRIICIYRGDRFMLPGRAKLKEGDEVLLITRHRQLTRLRERWGNNEGTHG